MNIHPSDKCGAVSSGIMPRYPHERQIGLSLMDKSGWEQLFLYFIFFLCILKHFSEDRLITSIYTIFLLLVIGLDKGGYQVNSFLISQ